MSSSSVITTNPFVRAIITVLPARMKRIVFLASLTAIAKESNVPEKALLVKLNTLLNLSSTGDAALKLPIHISQLIWANKQVFKADIQTLRSCQTNDALAQTSAEHIVQATPDWFSYAEPTTLIKDILALFGQDSCIFANKPLAIDTTAPQ